MVILPTFLSTCAAVVDNCRLVPSRERRRERLGAINSFVLLAKEEGLKSMRAIVVWGYHRCRKAFLALREAVSDSLSRILLLRSGSQIETT
jgi:hypothetical protein